MFLDDELLALGRGFEINNKNCEDSFVKMMQACHKSLKENVKANSTDAHIVSQLNRINNTFKKAMNILKDEGRGFITEDGFKLFTESTPLKGILK